MQKNKTKTTTNNNTNEEGGKNKEFTLAPNAVKDFSTGEHFIVISVK